MASTTTSKELKALLKLARVALDKGDYEEAIKQCNAVLWSDSTNYLANVIAGKANLLLQNVGEAKRLYKQAITINQDEMAAWKGLRDVYDKYGHNNLEEDIVMAIDTYQRMLNTQMDEPRRLVITNKLALMYNEMKKTEQACQMYERLLTLGPSLDSLREGVVYLLINGTYSKERWALIKDSYLLLVEGQVKEAQEELLEIYISAIMRWVMLLDDGVYDLVDHLKEYLPSLMEEHSDRVRQQSMDRLCIIELWCVIQAFQGNCRPQPLNAYQRDLFGKQKDISCYRALVLMDGKKIKEASEHVVKGITDSPNVCEYRLVSCVCHMMSHDYQATINNAREGLKCLHNAPLFLQSTLRNKFNTLMVEALVNTEDYETALNTINRELKSCDNHVTELHIKALLGLRKIDEAKKILSSADVSPVHEHLCKGLISMASNDYESAINELKHCVEATPTSSWYLYNLALCLIAIPTGNKKQAYEYLIKAAQLDPLNPRLFLQLGHYQYRINHDLKRAAKCYQKSFSASYSPVAAGLALGEVYMALKDEESAFRVYSEVIKNSLPSQTKEAWLRVGLYHRKNNRFEDAIKCFQTVLKYDLTDFRVWECVAEAYQLRGSQTSSLKAFSRAVELNPKSLYCHYQIASIQQSLGHLSKAIIGYNAVLNLDDTYVPALKGRAEVYYGLACQALEMTFDSKAVDLVSLALNDLAHAVIHQPSFICQWKLIGDCCVCLSPVSPDLVTLTVPVSLMSGNHSDVTHDKQINKLELLNLAISCYGHALQLTTSRALSSPLLHNMCLAYKCLASLDTDHHLKHMSAALQLIKKSVSLSPGNSHCWNTLGVIASYPPLSASSLAQHAFIKSLMCEPNNARAWTNLGSLYLTNGNIELAHSAFSRAQACDPTHIEGWIGDGIVAEAIGREDEANNFFYISSELGYHSESAMGCAQWVCHSLSMSKLDDIISTTMMSSLNNSKHQQVLQARDGLVKYMIRNPLDSCAWNLLGLLYEQEGMIKQATECIRKARELIVDEESGSKESSEYIMVSKNYARLLISSGESRRALDIYESLNSEGTPCTGSLDYALALHRSGRFHEAASVYDEAIVTDTNVRKRPYLLLASGMALFGDNADDCKSKLFKVYQTPPPIAYGMLSLAGFAGYSNDVTLLQATLNEIKKILGNDPVFCNNLHPSCSRALKLLKYHSQQAESKQCIDDILNAIHQEVNPSPVPQEVLQVIISQTPDQSLLSLQRIIHIHPNNLWVWSLLCYVLLVMGKLSQVNSCLTIIMLKVEQLTVITSSDDSKLLQLRTNELQTLQLLLAWCKQVVCGNCSPFKAYLSYSKKEERICGVCEDQRIQSNNDEDVVDGPAHSPLREQPTSRTNIPSLLMVDPKDREEEAVMEGYVCELDGKKSARCWYMLGKDLALYKFRAHEDIRATATLPLPGYNITPDENSLTISVSHPTSKKKTLNLKFKVESKEEFDCWYDVMTKATQLQVADTISRDPSPSYLSPIHQDPSPRIQKRSHSMSDILSNKESEDLEISV